MSRLLCLLAALAVITNSLVWSADAVAHLGDHAGGGVVVTEAGLEGASYPSRDEAGHGSDGHHCCHQLSHLSGLNVTSEQQVLPRQAGAHRRPVASPADGFSRSPYRPPSA